MKGFIQIPLLIAIVASVIIASTGVGLYFNQRDDISVTTTELIATTTELVTEYECPICECPTCECPICKECEYPICEPEIIIQEVEVIKEVIKEIIVEVPTTTCPTPIFYDCWEEKVEYTKAMNKFDTCKVNLSSCRGLCVGNTERQILKDDIQYLQQKLFECNYYCGN